MAIEKTKFAVSDGSRAIQSMILTAWSEGVGSNPAKKLGRGRKQRKPLAKIVYGERFGQPLRE